MCTNQFKKVEVVENKTPKNTIELGNIQIIGANDEQPHDIVEIGKEENYVIKIMSKDVQHCQLNFVNQ